MAVQQTCPHAVLFVDSGKVHNNNSVSSHPYSHRWSILTVYSVLWACLPQISVAWQHHRRPAHNDSATEVICRPFGACEPCPDDAVRASSYIPPIIISTLYRSSMNLSANHLATGASCIVYSHRVQLPFLPRLLPVDPTGQTQIYHLQILPQFLIPTPRVKHPPGNPAAAFP